LAQLVQRKLQFRLRELGVELHWWLQLLVVKHFEEFSAAADCSLCVAEQQFSSVFVCWAHFFEENKAASWRFSSSNCSNCSSFRVRVWRERFGISLRPFPFVWAADFLIFVQFGRQFESPNWSSSSVSISVSISISVKFQPSFSSHKAQSRLSTNGPRLGRNWWRFLFSFRRSFPVLFAGSVGARWVAHGASVAVHS